MLSINKISHTAGAVKNWTLNYAPWLLPGEVLSTAAITSSSDTLEVANVDIHLGRHVHFQIAAGEADELATLTVTVSTSKGETKIETLEVLVNNP